MTAAARDKHPLGEAELMARLIAAAHESAQSRLSGAEVDRILGVRPGTQDTAGQRT